MAAVKPHAKLPSLVAKEAHRSRAALRSADGDRDHGGRSACRHAAGWCTVADTLDLVSPASEDTPGATQFRRGYFIGDGTGAGKGRQVAGILADNWHQGRRKAIWFSKSDKLIEDAQRDWAALGESATPSCRFPASRLPNRSRFLPASSSRPMRPCARKGRSGTAAHPARALCSSSIGWA